MKRHAFALILSASALSLVLPFSQSCGRRWASSEPDVHFELKGKHVGVACESCHPVEQGLIGASPACESCHEPDRPSNHSPEPCGRCHTEQGWGDALVDHSFFALTGKHDRPCTDCHTDGTYKGLDPTCSSCHERSRPAGHFEGQDCAPCHAVTRWRDGEFDHGDYFPIPHRGEGQCASCHLDLPSYETFSCLDCHDHRRSKMNEVHKEKRGYSYSSAACVDCHPKGR